MTKLLIKLFINNSENIRSPRVRQAYGKLAGIVGIITNAVICIIKIITGILVNSIAIIGDGINNLSDTSSSIVTLFGFKMSSKKGDKEHPFGHARYEYIAGMIVAVIIIVVGFQILLSSIDKIRNPEPIIFSYFIIAILVFSIAVKTWQALFNIKLGKIINSSTLKATGIDSRNDVITTTTVLICIILDHITGLNIDGYIGVLVALFIMYSGAVLIKETSDPLLGQAPDPHVIRAIKDNILSFPGVLGLHDLVVHDYGPGNVFASVHIELDSRNDFIKNHQIIDDIENKVGRDLNIELVGHMDPIDTTDPLVKELDILIRKLIKPMPYVVDFHDLRIVKRNLYSNVMLDMVLSADYHGDRSLLQARIQNEISKHHSRLKLIIKFDIDYS